MSAATLAGSLRRALPPVGTAQRWTPRRKIAILNAVTRGEISLADARERWCVSIEELAEWSRELATPPRP